MWLNWGVDGHPKVVPLTWTERGSTPNEYRPLDISGYPLHDVHLGQEQEVLAEKLHLQPDLAALVKSFVIGSTRGFRIQLQESILYLAIPLGVNSPEHLVGARADYPDCREGHSAPQGACFRRCEPVENADPKTRTCRVGGLKFGGDRSFNLEIVTPLASDVRKGSARDFRASRVSANPRVLETSPGVARAAQTNANTRILGFLPQTNQFHRNPFRYSQCTTMCPPRSIGHFSLMAISF